MVPQVDLDTAFDKLKKAVNDNSFVITFTGSKVSYLVLGSSLTMFLLNINLPAYERSIYD